MENSFTEADLDKIREAKRLLNAKISWSNDPGGTQAQEAYWALNRFLEGPAAKLKRFCASCGQELKK